jgi:23S rRNA pseudouridine2605 synthase
VASRRAAEQLLRAGRVAVNGEPARLGDSADPSRDVVTLDGVRVCAQALEYWLVHKPAGVVTTVRDPQGRPTVLGLVPKSSARLCPVGRMDLETEGLILLTNDGDLAQRLLHPSHETEREYRVSVRGRVAEEVLRRLERGIVLEEGLTAPARCGRAVWNAASGTTRFALTLIEGRKRQIRRSLRTLGHPVLGLLRVRMGPLRLGRLPVGAARRLRSEECAALGRVGGSQGAGSSEAKGRARPRTTRPKSPPRARKKVGGKDPST